jgi:phosphatidate phosphatase LPIN
LSRDLQQKSINDDDQESGTGNSIPNSPVRDHENSYVNLLSKFSILILFFSSYLLGDVQLSLCGNLNKQSPITDEIFNAHLISYEKFVNNPTIIHDPNLIARIGGKYVINHE